MEYSIKLHFVYKGLRTKGLKDICRTSSLCVVSIFSPYLSGLSVLSIRLFQYATSFRNNTVCNNNMILAILGVVFSTPSAAVLRIEKIFAIKFYQ